MRCDHFWMIIIVNKRRSYQHHQGCFEEGVQLMSAELANDTLLALVRVSHLAVADVEDAERGERKY